MRAYEDNNTIRKGDLVWVKNLTCSKIDPRWLGPTGVKEASVMRVKVKKENGRKRVLNVGDVKLTKAVCMKRTAETSTGDVTGSGESPELIVSVSFILLENGIHSIKSSCFINCNFRLFLYTSTSSIPLALSRLRYS